MAFVQGTLWQLVLDATARALKHGALQPIATHSTLIRDASVDFEIRIVDLSQKRKVESGERRANPFRPYDPLLFVADLSETHVCLLNKFNVVAHHVLMVTREFEPQQSLLTIADCAAIQSCLQEFEGLAFYNGGQMAGASQPHKHLQLIPLSGMDAFPLAPIWNASSLDADGTGAAPLPFRHAIARAELDRPQSLHATYLRLLRSIDVYNGAGGEPTPYNLLVTRRWMFAVPRRHESYRDISLNSLGFAGIFLVRSNEQLDEIRLNGPLNALSAVV